MSNNYITLVYSPKILTIHIVACQAHPALVKIGPVLVPSFSWTKGLTDRVSPRLGGLAV